MQRLISEEDVYRNNLSWTYPVVVPNQDGEKTVGAFEGDGLPISVSNKCARNTVPAPNGMTDNRKEKNVDVNAEVVSMVPPEVKAKKRAVKDESKYELHLNREREQRKKMTKMFHDLGDIIPDLPPRADKVKIVDEAILYMQKLEKILHNMEKQKLKRAEKQMMPEMIKSKSISKSEFLSTRGFKTWASPNVVLNVAGNDAHLSIYYPRINPKPQLLIVVCSLMHNYNLSIISGHLNTICFGRMLFLHVTVAPDHFPKTLPFAEEIYKQVASDIMAWINA
ncbi:transcription factor bHLH95-like [Andrographis paniculata]|uniref:transcription factor bHLH95-like n=1 Tax=Andrographis paniculata TaxID=175694 RepID=UPI0021E6EE79|nr:transcription factor bHLH95-like [Andrographis paniculata]